MLRSWFRIVNKSQPRLNDTDVVAGKNNVTCPQMFMSYYPEPVINLWFMVKKN